MTDAMELSFSLPFIYIIGWSEEFSTVAPMAPISMIVFADIFGQVIYTKYPYFGLER